jgi:pimeloyl-ACP methyl ester carboxylesterase
VSALEIRHRSLRVGEVRLHCAEAGPPDGPLVLLLHGFPEHWITWRRQIPALAAAGFHVVAPDLRGYGDSDRPEGIGNYRIELLASDIAGLIDALGAASADVVGHDWGGVVAWHLAMGHPAKVRKLCVLNIPHPERLKRGLWTPRQLKKSWYAFFFQLPFLPEKALSANDFRKLRNVFRWQPLKPYAPAEIDEIIDALKQPGALTAALDYYRAAARPPYPRGVRIDHPVLVIWGERDAALGRELAAPDARWVPNVRLERIAEATHWVQADAPERVNALLLAFLR